MQKARGTFCIIFPEYNDLMIMNKVELNYSGGKIVRIPVWGLTLLFHQKIRGELLHRM